MITKTKEVFQQEALSRLIKLFQHSKTSKTDQKNKHRLEGFLHAGEYLGLITHEEGIDMLEQAHFEVFGESIKQKQARKAQYRTALNSDDLDFFDTPAIERLKNK